ncbi:glycosyltransferase family 2 protein [Sulfidibacter corallicola]|uniref:glycosyltransferase family 2 protein n=1 Tax=Sulfidibacter corallicola TaxID=2818388 RepID=UPI003B224418
MCLYYEEECVEEFVAQVRAALKDQAITYEIVFVDDGSQDRTVPLVLEMAERDDRIKLIQLSRNHGKEAAITAGITYARGEHMIMMDPDLQDPPEAIMDFYRKAQEGYDLVFGVRKTREDSLSTRLFSKLFWTFLNRLTGLDIPENLSVMRIFNRQFASEFLKYAERLRFIEGIFMLVGMRRTSMAVAHHKRFAGVSKFNVKKRIALALKAITSFSDKPIHLAIGTGIWLLSISLGYGLWAVIRKVFFNVALTGWTSLFVSILFVGSIQIILLGIIGNYVGRIYSEVKARPVFTVFRAINIDPDEEFGDEREGCVNRRG